MSHRRRVSTHLCLSLTIGLLYPLVNTTTVLGQLRIVTYNTNTFQPGRPDGVPRFAKVGTDVVIQAIGEEVVNGISQPPDILLFQEHQRPSTTTQNLVDRLNLIYGEGFYARGFEVGFTTGSSGTGTLDGAEIRPAVIYRTETVELLSEDSFGFASGSTQPRETLFYEFRPVGYGPEADFFVFNSHYKAGDGTSNLNRRFTEAINIRDRADSLGAGAHIIAAGDFNIDSSSEPSQQRLYAAPGTNIPNDVFTGEVGGLPPFSITVNRTLGDGRLNDPIDRPGFYNNNRAFADIHTQNPQSQVDDRFDFLLVSDEFEDNEGLSYIPGSYHTFGNNGSTFNDPTNVGNTININGLQSFTTQQVLNALVAASDHLPVVADFQLPAVLDAVVSEVPGQLAVGEAILLDVTISNAANVSLPIGADELDYSLTTSGNLLGSATGVDAALGGGSTHLVALDTTTPGTKTGEITVTTSSQGAANSVLTFPIAFEVLAPSFDGDFDFDNDVDGVDFLTWQRGFGNGTTFAEGDANRSRNIDSADLALWQGEYGSSTVTVVTQVPEPGSLVLLLGMGVLRSSSVRRKRLSIPRTHALR